VTRRSLVSAALAAYPAWWKARYGDEVRALCDDLVAEGRAGHRIVPGLLVGAADARLRGTGIPPVAAVHRARTRAALAVDAMAMLATVPLIAWVAVTTGNRSASVGGHAVPGVGHVTTASFPGLDVAGEVAWWAKFALVVLAAVLVVQLAGAWEATKPVDRHGWALLRWAPVAWVSVALGAALVHGHYLPARDALHGNRDGVVTVGYLPGAHPTVAAAFAVVAWVAVALLFTSSAALVLLTSRTDVGPARLVRAGRLGRRLSVTGALAALSSAAWAVGVNVQAPAPVHGSYAIVTSPLRLWAGPLAALALALAVLSWAGAAQARKSLRTINSLDPSGKAPSRV
jgi:hypothetical protein